MKKIAKSTIILSIFLVASKVLGFVREIILAYKFGTSYILDSYTIAISFPSFIFSIFANGVSQSYIPIYTRVKAEERNHYFNTTATFTTFIAITISLICYNFSDKIVALLAPGFYGESFQLSSEFIAITVMAFPFLVFFDLLGAHEQAKEKFIFLFFCDYIICNIITICGILLSNDSNPYVMIYFYVGSIALVCILFAFYAVKQRDIKIKISIDFKDENVKRLVAMAIPLGLSLLINELNGVVDRAFASSLGEGITSALNYSNRVQSLFLTLTTSVFMTVCFPRINQYFVAKDNGNAMYYAKKAVLVASVFSIPFMCLLVWYAKPIVRFFFERGSFTSYSTDITSSCLAFYAIGIPFYSLIMIETKVLIANLKQKEIGYITVCSVLLNIVLDSLFVKILGYKGLALATSIVGIFTGSAMLVRLSKMKLYILDTNILKEMLKIVVCSIGSVMCGFILSAILQDNVKIEFPIVICTCTLVYVTLCIVTKVNILQWMLNNLGKKDLGGNKNGFFDH